MSAESIGWLISFAIAIASILYAGWQTRLRISLEHKYESERRLLGAVGPLRLGLVLSSRSLVSRLRLYSDNPLPLRVGAEAKPIEHHNAGLFTYRLLRPLAHGVIIEHELYLTDLSSEPALLNMLWFNHAAFEMLTGDRITLGVDGADTLSCWWPDRPSGAEHDPKPPWQRIRSSYLRTAAAQLVLTQKGRERVMYHDEFLERWEGPKQDPEFLDKLEPVTSAIDGLVRPEDNPIFWLRLVGYAYVCREFFNRVCKDRRNKIRFELIELPVAAMLDRSPDAPPSAARHQRRFKEIVDHAL